MLAALGPSPSLGPAVGTSAVAFVDAPAPWGFASTENQWSTTYGVLTMGDVASLCVGAPSALGTHILQLQPSGFGGPYVSGQYHVPADFDAFVDINYPDAGFAELIGVGGTVTLSIQGSDRTTGYDQASGYLDLLLGLPDGGQMPFKGSFVAPTCIR